MVGEISVPVSSALSATAAAFAPAAISASVPIFAPVATPVLASIPAPANTASSSALVSDSRKVYVTP